MEFPNFKKYQKPRVILGSLEEFDENEKLNFPKLKKTGSYLDSSGNWFYIYSKGEKKGRKDTMVSVLLS